MARRTATRRKLDRDASTPLWAQLSEELVRRLETGAFDERFPSELELTAEYDVSRHTVRHALGHLRDAGVLDRRQGSGTVVRSGRIEQPLNFLYSLFRDVEATGIEQRSEVRALEVRRNAAAAAELGLSEDADLVYLERLRLAGGEPLALDHNWLPYSIGRHILDVDFSHCGLYDHLIARTGVTLDGGRERLRAVVPSAEVRRLLDMPRGVAAFEIERIACSDERPVEWRLSVVRGDRYAVATDWTSRHGYRLGVRSSA